MYAAIALAALLLMSFVALFFPPLFASTSGYVAWVAVFVSLCHLTYSGLSILHQAWATRLGGNALQQGRVIAWREAAGLVGVLAWSLTGSRALADNSVSLHAESQRADPRPFA
jgi:Na+/melibiose symporter-like transporter